MWYTTALAAVFPVRRRGTLALAVFVCKQQSTDEIRRQGLIHRGGLTTAACAISTCILMRDAAASAARSRAR